MDMAEHALLIEAEPEDALLLRVLLRRGGFKVEAVADVAAAQQAAVSRIPDVVVLDLHGSLVAGAASCRALRADPRLGQVPLVAIGAGSQTGERLREAGADVFVPKPVVPRRLEAELKTALAARAETDDQAETGEAADDWVQYLVHDLNNPIAVIGGSLSLIRGGDLDDRQVAALEHAFSAQDRLSRMVRALLDVQRVGQGGEVSLERAPLVLADLLQEAAAAVGPAARTRRCTVQVEAEAGLVVRADHELLLRALVNLGDNAARHTRRKTTIRFVATRTSDGARVGVLDQGHGVPAELREHIFQPFSQVEGRSGGSAGLGLAWCRIVAEAHGGRVWAEDAPGGGAAFYLSLPTVD